MIEEMAYELHANENNPEGYVPTADDVSQYLDELQDDKFRDQRNELMEILRDGLEDRHGLNFVLAAAKVDPTSTWSMGAFVTYITIIREHAAWMMKNELDGAWVAAGGRWYNEDPDEAYEISRQKDVDDAADKRRAAEATATNSQWDNR